MKDAEVRKFYMDDIEKELESYEPGKPCMKPDVLKQIIGIEERRRKEAEAMATTKGKLIQQGDGPPQMLTTQQIVSILQQQQQFIQKAQQDMQK